MSKKSTVPRQSTSAGTIEPPQYVAWYAGRSNSASRNGSMSKKSTAAVAVRVAACRDCAGQECYRTAGAADEDLGTRRALPREIADQHGVAGPCPARSACRSRDRRCARRDRQSRYRRRPRSPAWRIRSARRRRRCPTCWRLRLPRLVENFDGVIAVGVGVRQQNAIVVARAVRDLTAGAFGKDVGDLDHPAGIVEVVPERRLQPCRRARPAAGGPRMLAPSGWSGRSSLAGFVASNSPMAVSIETSPPYTSTSGHAPLISAAYSAR